MKNATSTISFRAPNQMLQQIDRQRAPFGISRGEWVRGAVQHYLQQLETPQEAETLATVREDIAGVAADICKVETNVTRSLYILLTLLGSIPADQAKDIVRSKLAT